MRVTKNLVAIAAAELKISADLAKTALNGSGLFRGADLAADSNFEKYRLDVVNGLEEDKLTYETIASEGGKVGKPYPYVVAADFEYVPLPGEPVMCSYHDEDDNYITFPALFQGQASKGTQAKIAGTYDGEDWEGTVPADEMRVAVVALNEGGLLTRDLFKSYLLDVNATGLMKIGTALHGYGLTYQDLCSYLAADAEELPATKFFKKVAKKEGLADAKGNTLFKTLPFLIDGTMEAVENVAEETAPRLSLEDFHASVSKMKATELKPLYEGIVKLAHIKSDDVRTAASEVKKHIVELVSTDIRLKKLIENGLV